MGSVAQLPAWYQTNCSCSLPDTDTLWQTKRKKPWPTCIYGSFPKCSVPSCIPLLCDIKKQPVDHRTPHCFQTPENHQPSSLNHEAWEDTVSFSHIFKSQDNTKISFYAFCSQLLMKWRSCFSGAESGLSQKNSLLSHNSGDPLSCTTVRSLTYPRAGSSGQVWPVPETEQNQSSPDAFRESPLLANEIYHLLPLRSFK